MADNAKAARRLPGKRLLLYYFNFLEINYFFYTFIWQMWRSPSDRQGAERAAYVVRRRNTTIHL
jgi:hypothetical protein